MSTDQPSGFASPDPGAPLTPPPFDAPAGPQQPAQPYPQQPAQQVPQAPVAGQVPPYGAAQQGMPYPQQTPYPQAMPYGGPQAAPVRLNPGLPTAVMVLAALYVVGCIIEIFVLNSRVSLANRLISDPTSVTIDQANSADSRVSAVIVVVLLVFLATIVVWTIWQRSLRKALAPTGQYQSLIRTTEFKVFRILWIASLLLAVFLRGNNDLATPQDVVSHDHEYMLYYGVRAVVGAVLVLMTLRINKEAQKLPQLAQGAYPQQPVGFPQS